MSPRPFALIAALLALAACSPRRPPPDWGDFGGDPTRGRAVIERASCGACHVIPGVPGAQGMTAPPLDHWARRTNVAGLLPNTPEHLVRWIRDPQGVLPRNAMPNAGLSELQARDVAAYLYTLR